ncbi:hypothetical protein NMG60_11013188 [Bertholletia excelsa]
MAVSHLGLVLLPLFLSTSMVLAQSVSAVRSEKLWDFDGPGLLPPHWTDKDIAECWKRLIRRDGCLTQIYGSMCKNFFTTIEPECCRAIAEIKHTCWARMFPFHPNFPSQIRRHCIGFAIP